GGLRLARTVALRRRRHPAQGPQRHHRHGAHHLGDVPDREHRGRSSDRTHQPAHPPFAEGVMKRATAILVRSPLSALGVLLVAIVVLSALLADFIAPFPSHVGAVVDFTNFNRPPGWPYIFGTDL